LYIIFFVKAIKIIKKRDENKENDENKRWVTIKMILTLERRSLKVIS